MTTALGEGMEEVFWDGIDGVGGWEQRSKDSPHDIFVCIGASCRPPFKNSCYNVDLGSNDQGWGSDKQEFLQRYQAFLIRLRDSYPNTLRNIHVIVSFES